MCNEVINSFELSTWSYPLSFERLHFTCLHSEGIVLNYSLLWKRLVHSAVFT